MESKPQDYGEQETGWAVFALENDEEMRDEEMRDGRKNP